MIGGIRGRWIAAMVLVTLLSSALVGIGLDRYTQREFGQFLEVEQEASFPPVDVSGLVRRMEAGDAVDEAIADLAAETGDARLLLFGREGTLLHDTDPRGEVRRRADGSLEITVEHETERGRRAEQIGIQGGLDLHGPGGPLGTLYILPSTPEVEALQPADGFERNVRRAHLVGVAIAALLGLVIAWALSGRMVGPLVRLTHAAESLAGGDLRQRVPEAGDDEIGKLSRAFNSMAGSLEEQEAMRKRMIGDVAHELRTPLTHLRCKLESAQDQVVPVDRDLVDGLHGEIVHLSRLVDDLQDLSLLEAGRFPLHPSDVDLVEASRSTLETLRTGHPEADVALEAPDALRAHVDADRFRQVLRNLVENALRHGPADGTVQVRLEAAGDGARCVVDDQGPGIPQGHASQVFDRFYRVDPSRNRDSGGAGLGLAICGQLVRAWGGDIGLEARETRGTRFWFTVP